MLKIGRQLGRLWNPICGMTQHQYFSVLFIKQKEFIPSAFDVLLQDVGEKDLHGEISKILGKTYLAPLQKNQKQFQETRTGVIYGICERGMISLPTRAKGIQQPIWVHYLVDTGSPHTYLSQPTLKALGANISQINFNVQINGFKCQAGHSIAHFTQINLLGMNFINLAIELNLNLQQRTIKIISVLK